MSQIEISSSSSSSSSSSAATISFSPRSLRQRRTRRKRAIFKGPRPRCLPSCKCPWHPGKGTPPNPRAAPIPSRPPMPPASACPHHCTCPRHCRDGFYLVQGVLLVPPPPAAARTAPDLNDRPPPPISSPLHRSHSVLTVVAANAHQWRPEYKRLRSAPKVLRRRCIPAILDAIRRSDAVGVAIKARNPFERGGGGGGRQGEEIMQQGKGDEDGTAAEVLSLVSDYHDAFDEIIETSHDVSEDTFGRRLVPNAGRPTSFCFPMPDVDREYFTEGVPVPSVSYELFKARREGSSWDPNCHAASITLREAEDGGGGGEEVPPFPDVDEILGAFWESVEKPDAVGYYSVEEEDGDVGLSQLACDCMSTYWKVRGLTNRLKEKIIMEEIGHGDP